MIEKSVAENIQVITHAPIDSHYAEKARQIIKPPQQRPTSIWKKF